MKERFTFLLSSDVFSHLTSLKYVPRWVVFSLDIFLCFISYYISFYLSTNLFNNSIDIRVLSVFERMGVIIGLQIFFFYIFHTYSGVLRYSGYVDAAKLLLAVFINIGFISLVNLVVTFFTGKYMFYYSALLIYGVLSFLLLFIIRLFVKTIYDYFTQNSDKITPVMIFGTQAAAIGIAKMIRSADDNKYKLVGFIDDDKNASQKVIMGVKVYHLDDESVKKHVVN